MEQPSLTQEESLRIIQSMIRTAQGSIAHNGFDFIFWGWAVLIASALHVGFMLADTPFDPGAAYWILPLCGVYMWFYHARKDKREPVETYINMLMPYIWGAFGVTMFIGIYFAVAVQTSPMPFILLFVGTATFISGGALKFRPLILGGVVFWISAAISFFLPPAGQIGAQAFSITVGYLIPGYMLMKNYKERDVQAA